jgi:hypothetical protein
LGTLKDKYKGYVDYVAKEIVRTPAQSTLSNHHVALKIILDEAVAKKMAKSNTETVTRTISSPKTKIIKQPAQQTSKTAANDAARTTIKPITAKKPLPNQQIN